MAVLRNYILVQYCEAICYSSICQCTKNTTNTLPKLEKNSVDGISLPLNHGPLHGF